MLGTGHGGRELDHFFGAKNDRKSLRLLGSGGDVIDSPGLFESHFVEEAKRRNSDENRTPMPIVEADHAVRLLEPRASDSIPCSMEEYSRLMLRVEEF